MASDCILLKTSCSLSHSRFSLLYLYSVHGTVMLFSRLLSAAVAVGRVLAAPTEDNALLARQDDNVALSIDTNSSPVEALEKLQAAAEEKINRLETERSSGQCSSFNTRIRKDWYVDNSLSTPPRVAWQFIFLIMP